MTKQRVMSNVALLLTACIWGVAFVAQSVGMDYIGPFTFNFARFLIGGMVLLPLMFRKQEQPEKEKSTRQESIRQTEERKATIVGGICCGIALCAGSLLQQLGIQSTSVGKAGFITALYIIIVPVFGIFLKKKIGVRIWISVVVAIIGFYFLCINENFSLAVGDFYLLLGALAFSVHIMVIDYFSPRGNSLVISGIQFFVSAMLSGIGAFWLEQPEWGSIVAAYVPILYAGVLSCGVAYTLQIVGQKYTSPTIASLILSLESVVAVLAGWLLLGQAMTIREIGGCALVFVAIIFSQLPEKSKNELEFKTIGKKLQKE